jgi:hypothetical protein
VDGSIRAYQTTRGTYTGAKKLYERTDLTVIVLVPGKTGLVAKTIYEVRTSPRESEPLSNWTDRTDEQTVQDYFSHLKGDLGTAVRAALVKDCVRVVTNQESTP